MISFVLYYTSQTGGCMKKRISGKYDHFIEGGILLGIGIVFILILAGVFGNVGGYITNFFVGTFGFAIYAFVVAIILVGLLKCVNIKAPKAKLIRILGIFGFVSMIIFLLHIVSSYQYMGGGYGDFIAKCYNEHDTAGGALTAVIIYPLLSINYYFAIVVVSLLAIASSGVVIFHGSIEGVVRSRSKSNDSEGREIGDEDTNYKPVGDSLNIDEVSIFGTKKTQKRRDKGEGDVPSYVSLEELSELRAKEEYARDNNIAPEVAPPTTMLSKAKSILKKQPAITNTEENSEYKFNEAVDMLYGRSVRDQANIQSTDSPEEIAKLVSYTNDYRLNKLRKKLNGDTDNSGIIEELGTGLDEFDTVIDDVARGFDGDNYESAPIASDIDDDIHVQSGANPDYFKVEEITINKETPEPAPVNSGISSELAARLAKHKAKRDKAAGKTPPPTTYEESGNFTDMLRKQREEREAKAGEELRGRHMIDEKPSVDDVRDRRERSDKGFTHQSLASKNGGLMSGSTRPLERIDNTVATTEVKVVAAPKKARITKYKFPPISLLNDYKSNEDGNDDLSLKCNILEEMFDTFHIQAKVVNTVVGPTFTRMELAMPRGISVNKIANLGNDIAMCLEVESVRCQIPIPGKNLFGVEVPNKVRGMVGLKQVIKSTEFANPKHSITFALGQDCDGNNFVADLAKMPHLLIAGATGAGKSVCLNSLICSMVYKYTPQELKLLLVDPKHVELNMYNGIPHMLIPTTVCDKDKALNMLDWAIEEMELRYSTFASNRVQNIGDYNKMPDLKAEDKLPHIAIIIDEVGDLMTYVKKELEERIVRLTQKARAAGICLILATQRPSVDVITGIIKANLPSRIAFAVASYVDSKTIIDQAGAEKLLRNGDMLFSESSSPLTVRIQGTFISGAEVNAICDYIRENNVSYFDPEIENMIMNDKPTSANPSGTSFSNSSNTSFEEDDMFVRALFYFVETKTVSITKLQRRFSIGFPRAARIVDIMEEKGYVSINGNKKEIAISLDDFTRLYGDRVIE